MRKSRHPARQVRAVTLIALITALVTILMAAPFASATGTSGNTPKGPDAGPNLSTSTPTLTATTTASSGGNASVNLDQWANLPNQGWRSGDLNGSNSSYAEGKVVPFRLAIEGLTAGTHTIHLNYDFTAGGHHAYDFLATYKMQPRAASTPAPPAAEVSSLCGSLPPPSTVAFPSDPYTDSSGAQLSVSGAQSASGVDQALILYGGSITNISTRHLPHGSGHGRG